MNLTAAAAAMSNGDVPIRAASAKQKSKRALLKALGSLILRFFDMQQREACDGPQRQSSFCDVHHSRCDHQVDVHGFQPPHQLSNPLRTKPFRARQRHGVRAATTDRGQGVRSHHRESGSLGRGPEVSCRGMAHNPECRHRPQRSRFGDSESVPAQAEKPPCGLRLPGPLFDICQRIAYRRCSNATNRGSPAVRACRPGAQPPNIPGPKKFSRATLPSR